MAERDGWCIKRYATVAGIGTLINIKSRWRNVYCSPAQSTQSVSHALMCSC